MKGAEYQLTDSQGVVTDTFAYAPFGELIQRTGTTDTPFLYNGRDGVMTDGNGLYYMRARYYNPDIKRFINQDVLQGSINNGQSMNGYAYVNGNPVSQVDPFGLCAESTNSNSLIHLILGGLSYWPGLNVPASLLDFALYLKEGDHVNAGIALACIVPFAKEGVLGIKVAEAVLEDGSKVVIAIDEAGTIGKLAERAGNAAEEFVNLASPNRTTHILYGDKTGGGHLWPGQSGKSVFPESWSADKVMHNISDIATDPTLTWQKGRVVKGVQRYEVIGVRDGVQVKVITDGSDIITAFPTK